MRKSTRVSEERGKEGINHISEEREIRDQRSKIKDLMALQWMIMAYVAAAEAAVALVVTLPSPAALKKRLVSAVSLILQPALFVVPFAAFHLLDIYWKNERRLMCTSEVCTAADTHRYHKSIYKSQRNAILCVAACLLYWSIYRICKYQKVIQILEDVEKRYKAQ